MSRIIAWGAYDQSKPRVRLLLDELRARDLLAAEINIPVWAPIRDKGVAGPARLLKVLLRLLAAYPSALLRLLRQPRHAAVLLPYPAIPDIFVAWLVARPRRQRIILDAFISLHDTIVTDRAMVRWSLVGKLIWGVEWLSLQLADIILVDTDQHGEFFAREFGIARDRLQTIFVGAEPAFWAARRDDEPVTNPLISRDRPTVLFYGQLIPLHGIETILAAVERTAGEPIQWLLIGSGQDESKVRRFMDYYGGGNFSWVPWVSYEQLPGLIAAASVALGVFGTSKKAARVIPNKVFQILATGKPVVTRASPAVDAIANRYPGAIVTVPAGDGAALANAIRKVLHSPADWRPVPGSAAAELGPARGVEELAERLR